MKHLASGLAVLGLVLVTATAAAGQAPAQGGRGGQGGAAPAPPPPPPQNLQVLPKDIARQDLLSTMRSFTAALGVNCGYCHVWIANNDPNNDMPSDAKPTKHVARTMLRLVGDVNAKLATDLGKPVVHLTLVQCATCHRGAVRPALQ